MLKIKRTILIITSFVVLLSMIAGLADQLIKLRKDNKRKDQIILAKTEDIKTWQDEQGRWVTERRTYELTVKELKHSKDSVVQQLYSKTKELGIKKRNIASLQSNLAVLEKQYSVVTEKLNNVQDNDNSGFVNDFIDSVNSENGYEYEVYADQYNHIERIKPIGLEKATYNINIRVPITQIGHYEKTKYKDKSFFVTRFVVKLFEKKQLFMTVTSDNPDVKLEYTEHINIKK